MTESSIEFYTIYSYVNRKCVHYCLLCTTVTGIFTIENIY